MTAMKAMASTKKRLSYGVEPKATERAISSATTTTTGAAIETQRIRLSVMSSSVRTRYSASGNAAAGKLSVTVTVPGIVATLRPLQKPPQGSQGTTRGGRQRGEGPPQKRNAP